jgi:hypothetical protein
MVRINQTTRKSTGEAPPRLHLATNVAQAAAQKAIAMRKPCCWRPGTVALREIRKFQTQISSSGKPPSSVLYKRSYKTCPERLTCTCRAQLSWLSRRQRNTSWLMSFRIPTCARCTASVKPSWSRIWF